jgi:hypothetical protein
MPLRLHSCAAIGYSDGHACGSAISGDDQSTFFWHGLQRVDDDVQECTLHYILESENLFRATRQLEDNLDAVSNRSGRYQIFETLTHGADIKRRRLFGGFRPEDQLDWVIEALHFTRNGVEASRHRRIDRGWRSLKQPSQQRAVDPDDVKHSLEIVWPVTREKCKRPVTGRLLQEVRGAGQRSRVAQQQYSSFLIDARYRAAPNAERANTSQFERGLVANPGEALSRKSSLEILQSAFQGGLRIRAQQLTRTVIGRHDPALAVQHDNAQIAQVEFNSTCPDRALRYALINPHEPGLAP